MKIFDKLDKEIILKLLYIIQILYKTEESLGEHINSTIINTLFLIMNTSNDLIISKSILNTISAFSLNDDLNIFIRMNWLGELIKKLVLYALMLKTKESVHILY